MEGGNQVKRVSSIDVAKLAGVSQSSVSRVFSPNAKVAESTRQRILEAADMLGYKPNALARGLINQSTNLIGVVVADVASLFYAPFLSKLTEALRKNGKQVILFNVGLAESADDVVPKLLEYRVDAVIIAATTLSADMATDCARNGTPVILFNRALELAQVSSICVDNEGGGHQIADLFLTNNHKRYAYIAGIESTQTNRLREKGYLTRLRYANVTDVLCEQSDFTYQGGFDAATRLLSHTDRPDAIFCADDTTALGAIDAARSLGLRVPEDVSIAGFDNVPQASWQAYQLTTIAQPLAALLEATLYVLEQRLKQGREYRPKIDLIPSKLHIRNSVRINSD